MGSANSNMEALERRRIEREMRLGLCVGSSQGLNAGHLGMQPVNPYQHLGWPPQAFAQQRPMRAAPSLPQHYGQYPSGRYYAPSPPRAVSPPMPQRHLIPVPQASARRPGTPERASPSRPRLLTPTKLEWVGTPPRRERDPSPMDLLTPARNTLRYLMARDEDSAGHSTPPRQTPSRSPSRGGDPSRRRSKSERGGKCDHLKPIVKQALYLLALDELEERACILNDEAAEFDQVLALFSYAVELEFIRVTAFEMFHLEKKARKAISSQEKRDRHIIDYWVVENYEDAKLSEGIRNVQRRESPQRTASRSFRRFPTALSDDRFCDPAPGDELRIHSFLGNGNASPSPVRPSHATRAWGDDDNKENRVGVPMKHQSEPERIILSRCFQARFGVEPKISAQSSPSRRSPQHHAQYHVVPDIHAPPRTGGNPPPHAAPPAKFNVKPSIQIAAKPVSISPRARNAPPRLVHTAPAVATTAASTRLAPAAPAARSPALPKHAPITVVAVPGKQPDHGSREDSVYYYYHDDELPQQHDGTPTVQAGVATPQPPRISSAENTRPQNAHYSTQSVTATAAKSQAPPARRQQQQQQQQAATAAPPRREPGKPAPRPVPIDTAAQFAAVPEARHRQEPPSRPPGVVLSTNAYRLSNDYPAPSQLVDGLSPIQPSAPNEDGTASDSSSVYFDPFVAATPRSRRPTPPPLGAWQDELDRKIMQQRGSMVGGSPNPHRAAPQRPAVRPDDDRHYDVGRRSYPDSYAADSAADAVRDRFAALLNARE